MRLQLMSMLGVHHNAELKVLQLCFLQPPTSADDDDFTHVKPVLISAIGLQFSQLIL